MSINSVLRESINYEDLRRRLLDASPDLDERTLLDTLEVATNLQEAIAAVIRSALDDEALAKALRSRIERSAVLIRMCAHLVLPSEASEVDVTAS